MAENKGGAIEFDKGQLDTIMGKKKIVIISEKLILKNVLHVSDRTIILLQNDVRVSYR